MLKKTWGLIPAKAEEGKGCVYLCGKTMADHVFFSMVPAMLSGFSDSVASVPSQKFAVRTRQRFLEGQMLTVHPAGEGKGASSEMNVILLPYMLGTLCCQLSL